MTKKVRSSRIYPVSLFISDTELSLSETNPIRHHPLPAHFLKAHLHSGTDSASHLYIKHSCKPWCGTTLICISLSFRTHSCLGAKECQSKWIRISQSQPMQCSFSICSRNEKDCSTFRQVGKVLCTRRLSLNRRRNASLSDSIRSTQCAS